MSLLIVFIGCRIEFDLSPRFWARRVMSLSSRAVAPPTMDSMAWSDPPAGKKTARVGSGPATSARPGAVRICMPTLSLTN
jgi:hypothetical protein